MPLSAEERTQRARIAALTRWSRENPADQMALARASGPSSDAYWLHEVDPHDELDEAERARRATAAKKAHFARLAYKSAQARRKAS